MCSRPAGNRPPAQLPPHLADAARPGAFVRLHLHGLEDYAQVLEWDDVRGFLVKLYPRIDYSESQGASPPPPAPFCLDLLVGTRQSRIRIWGKEWPCITWKDRFFIGAFEYCRVSDWSAVTPLAPGALPRQEFEKFTEGIEDFEQPYFCADADRAVELPAADPMVISREEHLRIRALLLEFGARGRATSSAKKKRPDAQSTAHRATRNWSPAPRQIEVGERDCPLVVTDSSDDSL
jgi:hypothetical protein